MNYFRRGRPFLPAVLTLAVCLLAGCHTDPEEDLIAQSWRADVFSERVGASLIRDGDEPDLISGWADVELEKTGALSLWAVDERSLLSFHLNRVRPLRLRLVAQPIVYAGRAPASLEIRVNGHALGETPLKDDEDVSAILPIAAGLLWPGKNILEFVHPWAKSPLAAGLSQDPRPLAVIFSVLALEEMSAGENGAAVQPNAPANYAPELRYEGPWNAVEEDPASGVRAYRWLMDLQGALEFSLIHPAGDLKFKYKATAFGFPGAPAQQLRWLLNGRLLSTLVIRADWNDYQLALPEAWLRPGANRLECRAGYSRRPSGVLKSADERELSVALGDEGLEPGALAFPSGALLNAGAGRLDLPAGYQLVYTFPLPERAKLRVKAAGSAAALRITAQFEAMSPLDLYEGSAGGASGSFVIDGEPGRLLQLRIANEGAAGSAPVSLIRLALQGVHALPFWMPVSEPAPRKPGKGVAPPRTVLIYLVDTLRADHLSAYGYPRDTSPGLADFSRTAELYENAQAVTSWTKAATASVLTGLPPELHGADGQLSPLSANAPYLPAQLRDSGYRTLGIISNAYVSRDFGFGRGFDHFIYVEKDRPLYSSAEAVNGRLAAALEEIPARQPLFVYIHTVDPHFPYEPLPVYDRFSTGKSPAQVTDQSGIDALESLLAIGGLDAGRLKPMVDQYDGEVAQADAGFAKTLKILAAHGRSEDALIIFLSDHGEEFGEHHGIEHGKTLFAEVTHIPLLIRWPDGHGAGVRRPELVSQLDLAPTVRRAAGMPPESAQGVALDIPPMARPLFASLELGGLNERRVDWGRWSYHRIGNRISPQYFGRPVEYLFDRKADPAEFHPMQNEQPVVTAYLRALSRARLGALAVATGDATVGESTVRQLKALGYLH